MIDYLKPCIWHKKKLSDDAEKIRYSKPREATNLMVAALAVNTILHQYGELAKKDHG